MATIRAALDDDLPAISKYLADRMDGNFPPALFRRCFEYRWARRQNLGFLIDDGGSVRGFIGAIYSDRHLRGADHQLCNINSWSVDEDYRKLSLPMAKRLLDQPDFTFTCFSPSKVVAECLRFFKFETSPVEKVLFTPAHGLLRALRRLPFKVVTPDPDPASFEALLDETQRRLYRDHLDYRCAHLLIHHEDRRCYVVTVRRGRGWRAFADVLYASDPELLVEFVVGTHLPLWRAHGTFLTGIDRRWFRKIPHAVHVYRGLRPLQWRSRTLNLADIDALYTELVTLYA
jgi:hypothetical protein